MSAGYEFNLKSLNRSGGWEVNDRDGHVFKLNVCGPVSSTGCLSSTGSTFSSKSYMLLVLVMYRS